MGTLPYHSSCDYGDHVATQSYIIYYGAVRKMTYYIRFTAIVSKLLHI